MSSQQTEVKAATQATPITTPFSIRKIFPYCIGFFLFVVVLAVFVPLNPQMPSAGLDPSWKFAMNQGVARELVFGKDIVFTFGPYSSIYTELYDPATGKLMVFGSLFLGICCFLQLSLLGGEKNNLALLFYGIFLACLLDSRDALLFSYPLILSLATYRQTLPEEHEWKLRLKTFQVCILAFVFAPLGMLPLIKVSLLPICGVTALFCSILLMLNQKSILAASAIIVPSTSCAVLWSVSGQPLLALPRFFWNMRKIISGYNEAMSTPGNTFECVFYLLAAIVILLAIFWTINAPKRSILFLSASFAFFLFLAFKAGFIRHDAWHNIIPGTSILAAAVLLLFVSDVKTSIFPIGVALLAWIYIGHGITRRNSAQDISRNFRTTLGTAIQEATAEWPNNSTLQNRYIAQIAEIRTTYPVPTLPGTMDIYSYNQSILLASENAWLPRPVMQSYSAYTAELAELNLRHLLGSDAPDNILFRVEPIDGRLASLEDGLSWPALINRYSVQKLEGGTAYLRKKTGREQNIAEDRDEIYSATQELGEDVTLPDSSDPLFARMEIDLTFLGKIRSALFKSPELHITMRLRNGSEATFRLISTMIKSDFLITPLVRNTEEFVKLAAGGNEHLTGNEVKSMVISADDPHGLFWNRNYSLKLSKLNLLKNQGAENSLPLEKVANATSGNPATSSAR
jgi:hypothetical protein